MAQFTIAFADGSFGDMVAANREEAVEKTLEILSGDGYDRELLVAADQWDADGESPSGKQCFRLLIWENESDAKDDSGERSIASVSTTSKI